MRLIVRFAQEPCRHAQAGKARGRGEGKTQRMRMQTSGLAACVNMAKPRSIPDACTCAAGGFCHTCTSICQVLPRMHCICHAIASTSGMSAHAARCFHGTGTVAVCVHAYTLQQEGNALYTQIAGRLSQTCISSCPTNTCRWESVNTIALQAIRSGGVS